MNIFNTPSEEIGERRNAKAKVGFEGSRLCEMRLRSAMQTRIEDFAAAEC